MDDSELLDFLINHCHILITVGLRENARPGFEKDVQWLSSVGRDGIIKAIAFQNEHGGKV